MVFCLPMGGRCEGVRVFLALASRDGCACVGQSYVDGMALLRQLWASSVCESE